MRKRILTIILCGYFPVDEIVDNIKILCLYRQFKAFVSSYVNKIWFTLFSIHVMPINSSI